MRIVGAWVGPKGKERPCVDGVVSVTSGKSEPVAFVVNTGTEATAISRGTFNALDLAANYLPTTGLKRRTRQRRPSFVRVPVTIELSCPPDPPYRIIGMISAAIDPAGLAEDVLGLDVLRLFHVIASHQRGEVLLLSGSHAYQLTGRP